MQDILTLDYSALASSAAERLNLLISIQVTLGKPIGSHRASKLGLSPNQWQIFSRWLAAGEAYPFWQSALGGVMVLKQPLGHVIIGTSELVGDIATQSLLNAGDGAATETISTNGRQSTPCGAQV